MNTIFFSAITLSVLLSAWMITEPVDSPDAKALPLTAKGKDPDL